MARRTSLCQTWWRFTHKMWPIAPQADVRGSALMKLLKCRGFVSFLNLIHGLQCITLSRCWNAIVFLYMWKSLCLGSSWSSASSPFWLQGESRAWGAFLWCDAPCRPCQLDDRCCHLDVPAAELNDFVCAGGSFLFALICLLCFKGLL